MRHTANAILAKINDIARQVFEDPALEMTLDTTSDDVPRWDSMSHIALMVECECRFGLRFQSMEIEELRAVDQLVRLIQDKLELINA